MEVNSLYVKKDMSISRDQSAAMKGLMISLIVLGHCRFFSSAFPTTWEWLYCFHVTGFFILPWFYGNNEFSWTQVTKYAKRLLWPYAYMFIFLFLLNYIITHTIICDSGVFNTFFTGNFYKLRQYTGFQYIWFLPAMFSMMVLKDLLYIVNKYWKIVIIVLGAIFFLTCWIFMWRAPYPSFINHKMASFSVLSFMIGFAMMFLGFITRKIMEKWTLSSFFLVVIMIMGLIAMILTSSFQNFNYVKWVCRIVCPIACFALLFRGGWYNILILRELGRFSFPIYLIHQPVNQIVYSILQHFNLHSNNYLLFSFVLVLSVSYMISKAIFYKEGIKKMLFPR